MANESWQRFALIAHRPQQFGIPTSPFHNTYGFLETTLEAIVLR